VSAGRLIRPVALAALALATTTHCDDRKIVDRQRWTFTVEYNGKSTRFAVETYGKCGETSPDPLFQPRAKLEASARANGCVALCQPVVKGFTECVDACNQGNRITGAECAGGRVKDPERASSLIEACTPNLSKTTGAR
jgi:hypothetical protein